MIASSKVFFGGMMTYAFLRAAGMCGAASTLVNLTCRYFDSVEGTDPFSQHTMKQHRKHPLSGMHEPFFASSEQRSLCLEHFPEHGHLLPASEDAFKQQQALKTAVRIKSLPAGLPREDFREAGTVVVGGPPALISSANQRNVTYINDMRRHPISRGSAYHLEHDAAMEGPSDYLPSHFMVDQIFRTVINYQSLRAAEKTTHFPWRSFDWAGWIKHPQYWMEGLRIALAFEKTVRAASGTGERRALLQEVADRCKANQAFYEGLDAKLDHQLLLPGRGAVMLARNAAEEEELLMVKEDLALEDRTLAILSADEMQARYGFVPPGAVAFTEKTHDMILSPNWMELIAHRIQTLGGKVIDGTLKTIYVDNLDEGGFVKYITPDGEKNYLPFSELVLSLGNQRIMGKDGRPIVDVIAARGVSALAIAYVPKGRQLPQVFIYGDTNNVTMLSGPVSINGREAYLLRMTAGACITPNRSDPDSADYDAAAAVGLIAATRKALDCEVDILTVYGCNRQVSEFGQSHWFTAPVNDQPEQSFLIPRGHHLDCGTHRNANPYSVKIQVGAAGGGLTQGPAQPPLA